MANDTRIFSVDKFLGINESADSETELKPGEASRIVNFTITDGGNLAVRPGISRFDDTVSGLQFRDAVPVWRDGKDWIRCTYVNETDHSYYVYDISGDDTQLAKGTAKDSADPETADIPLKTFVSGGKPWIYVVDTENIGGPGASDSLSHPGADHENIYIPFHLSNLQPTGGGTVVEQLNILANRFRIQLTGDGKTKDYVLPELVTAAYCSDYAGTYDPKNHTFSFDAVTKETEEILLECVTNDPDILAARKKFISMKYFEQYNGATDTRTFFYGDGSNTCYYTGSPAYGSGLYIPAGNEISVDFSGSPITGMIRHYSRLLAFKPDGVDAISYEPVTLSDGSVVAGFYVRPVSRDQGNIAMGQLSLVNNSTRSLSSNNVYDWRLSSGNYRDERYTKLMSEKVFRTLAKANLSKAKACDNDEEKTWYLFLNDEAGTVLIHRYELDVWSIWKCPVATAVDAVFSFGGKTVFLSRGELFYFDDEAAYDAPADPKEPKTSIEAVWESGMMDFSAPFRRKYSSHIWLSLLPQSGTDLEMTAKTDKSDQYVIKTVKRSLLDFSRINFGDFTFQTVAAPTTNRVKMKVKKFIFYKLIFRIAEPGARATVLGYDQQIRYSSNVK